MILKLQDNTYLLCLQIFFAIQVWSMYIYSSFVYLQQFQLQQTTTLFMSMVQSQPVSIRQAFTMSRPRTHFSEIQGYKVPKHEVNPAKMIEERQNLKIKKGGKPRVKPTKRGSYLEDEVKIHKLAPGPGKYPVADEWPEKTTLKSKYSQRLTFIQDIMKRQKKEKRPAPGFYNVFKSLKQQQQEVKKYSARKVKAQDRMTFLDSVLFQATANPGIGNYNIRRRSQTETSFSKYKSKPEDWRKKHIELLQNQKKKVKAPTATSYSPKPSDFTLFSTMGKGKSKNGFGKTMRFKTSGSVGGSGVNPTKYSIMQEWRGKGKKLEKHGLEVLSRVRTYTSVYQD